MHSTYSLPAQSKIGWFWGTTSDNQQVPKPVMGFYRHTPADAECIFSDKTSVDRDVNLDREAVAWDDKRLQTEADAIRAKYPREARKLIRPTQWEDLYRYFHVVDLWEQGAWNLWWVLQRLCDENEDRSGRVRSNRKASTGQQLQVAPRAHADLDFSGVIDDWAYKWCTHGENRRKLSTWDQHCDILNVLTQADWDDIGDCETEALNVLRGALQYWHNVYFSISPVKHRFTKRRASKQNGQAGAAMWPSNGSMQQWNSNAPSWNDGTRFCHQPSFQHFMPNMAMRTQARSSSASAMPALPMAESAELTRESVPTNITPGLTMARPVIVNGTRFVNRATDVAQGVQCQPSSSGESAASGQTRKGHQHSKSSPVLAHHALAGRRAGVEDSGPSRLPHRFKSLPPVLNNAPRTQEPMQRGFTANSHNPALRQSSYHGNSGQQLVAGKRPGMRSGSQNCKNNNKSASPYETYEACDCMRCTHTSRSAVVQNLPAQDGTGRDRERILTEYFSRWGHVENCQLKTAKAGSQYAVIRFAREDSALLAVPAANGQPILPLTERARVKHPFYSKYHVPASSSLRNGTTDRPWSRPRYGSDASMARRPSLLKETVGVVQPLARYNNPEEHASPSSRALALVHTTSQQPSPISTASRSPAMRTTPSRQWNPDLPPGPVTPRTARSASTARSARFARRIPSSNHSFVPQHHAQGSWAAADDQQLSSHHPPFPQHFPSTAYGPHPQTYFGPQHPRSPPHGWAGMYAPHVMVPYYHQHYQPYAYPQPAFEAQQVQLHEIPSAPQAHETQSPAVQGHYDDSSQAAQTHLLLAHPSKTPAVQPGAAAAMQTKPPFEDAFSQDRQLWQGSTDSASDIGSIRVRLPNMSPENSQATASSDRQATRLGQLSSEAKDDSAALNSSLEHKHDNPEKPAIAEDRVVNELPAMSSTDALLEPSGSERSVVQMSKQVTSLARIFEADDEYNNGDAEWELPPTSHFTTQDVRLELPDPSFDNTVIRRPNLRRQHHRIPSSWRTHDDGSAVSGDQDVAMATSAHPFRSPQDAYHQPQRMSRPVTPAQQDDGAAGQDQKSRNKYKRTKKKAARKNVGSGPSISTEPQEKTASVSEGPDGTAGPSKAAAPLQKDPNEKGYRADAGGSLRVSRMRKNPPMTTKAARENPPVTGEPRASTSASPTEQAREAEQSPAAAEEIPIKKKHNPHGSFRNLPIGFDPFPRDPKDLHEHHPPKPSTTGSKGKGRNAGN
ncbi:hypothetical protein VTK56DRAFT_2186 [Thermocarpiscus australiensis]